MECLIQQIVSGGQTGADRAALDWAIAQGVRNGGWCPRGRRAEDGIIDARYCLRETLTQDYAERTERNVHDSDGTVVISIGGQLQGGSTATVDFARQHCKPHLHISGMEELDGAARRLRQFVIEHGIRVLNVAGPRTSEEPGIGEWVSRVLTSGLLRACHPDCEVWFCGDKVVVDSCLPLEDLKVREFARPRIVFERACYYVSEKSRASTKPILYRYVLTPWPEADQSNPRTITLDDDYFRELAAGRARTRLERIAFLALMVVYPFLGFLWSPQKRVLNRIGFESHALSSMSTYAGFVIGFSCAVFLVVFEFGSKTVSIELLLSAIAFMTDAAMRFHRLLLGEDPVPPGFFEWLLRRKKTYE